MMMMMIFSYFFIYKQVVVPNFNYLSLAALMWATACVTIKKAKNRLKLSYLAYHGDLGAVVKN